LQYVKVGKVKTKQCFYAYFKKSNITMKKQLLLYIVALLSFSTGVSGQLISGDVNKPINQVYKLAAANYGTPQEPTFSVSAPTACSGAGSTGGVTISWASGTTAGSIRYFAMHNAMDFNGNLLYPCSPSPCPPGALVLNNGNSFSATYTNLAPGIYTFGIHRDPYDDDPTTNQPTPINNVYDDYAIGGWNSAAGDQNRCAVVGVMILPVNSNNLTTCSITYTNASNCTSANGSVTISGLAVNTNYETSHLVNGAWSAATSSGPTGSITIPNLLTGIYPVRIRRQGEICYRQFNIKVGNNSGIECFADNQLLDPSLGTSLVTGGDFGLNSGALPANGTTDYTLVAGGFAANNPGDSRYVFDDTTDHTANGITITTEYDYRLRNMSFNTQKRHLWACFQLTGDHTGSSDQNNGGTGNGLGYMMIVNANYRTDRVVNISNIGITAGRSYVFSFWAKNLQPFMPRNKNNGTSLSQTYQPIIPRLAMAVNGIIYDFADLGATLEPAAYSGSAILDQMGWEQYNLRLIAPTTNANSNITIYNFQQGGFGNDFTIDDVQFLALSVIGDRIWNDLNRDGIQDLNEPGMANVTATLLDANSLPLQTTVSDAFGYYQFANIAPAAGGTSYRVRFTLPAGYTFSNQTAGGGAGNSTDSDPSPVTGTTAPFTISVGETEVDIDCGLVFDQPQLPSSISDYVWFDTNGDGIQNTNESGLANVTLTLYNNAGTVVATTVTNAGGNYRFDNVVPGNYRVGITQPSGTICTLKDQGANDNTDSDINTTGANIRKTDLIVVAANTQITNVDIGLALMPVTSSSFGDYCWNDLNKDGIQAANEPGLANVKVVLCQPGPDNLANTADDIRVDSMFTDVFGKWQFTSLTGTRYFVRFSPPAGYSYTLLDAGTDDAVDSDVLAPGISGVIGINNTPSGFNYEVLDVGFYLTTPVANAGTIGDFFWNDINGNGIQETGEFGVPGITVELQNSTGTVIATTTTNWTGYYIFTNVAPAAGYTVKFSNIPPGFQVTAKDQGADDNTDSDLDMATGISNSFTVANNQNITNIDGAIRQVLFTGNSSIGSLVWYDIDGDGIQDVDETGIPDIAIVLREAGADGTMGTGDDVLRLAVTNSLGQFMFNSLSQGLYRVEFNLLPATLTLSPKDAGTSDNADSDGNTIVSSASVTDNFRLLFGEDKVNIALGLVPDNTVRRIGNRVWADDNGNGLQDAGENDGVQSVVVQLLDGSGNLIDKDAVLPGIQPWQTVSNANGYWMIAGIPNGNYIPRFSYLPPGFRLSPGKIGTNNAIDSDVQGNGRSSITVIITNGQRVNNDIDLGLTPQSAVLGDFVWDDLNGNGLQDASEPGIVSTTATIYNSANVALGSAITNEAGKYNFPNIPFGDYYLRFSNYPVGMQFTLQESNPYATNGNNVNQSTQRTNTYNISGYGDTLHIDAGLRVLNTANIGNYVWFDKNNNGLQESTESPLAGVVVTLFNAGPNGIAGDADDYAFGTTITDGNGFYQFIITPTGNNYYLRFSNTPLSSLFTNANQGSGANDSRPNNSGVTPTFNLGYGGTNQNQDAGVISITILPIEFELFTAEKTTAGSLLTWQTGNAAGITGYEVMHSTNGNEYQKITSIPARTTGGKIQYLHASPAAGKNYYKIVAKDPLGRQYNSEVRILDYEQDGGFSIYPNPAAEYIYITNRLMVTGNLKYKITDVSGKTVQQGQLNNNKIDIKDVASGTYTIMIVEQKKVLFHKNFIKK
jgi:hypothetical protein